MHFAYYNYAYPKDTTTFSLDLDTKVYKLEIILCGEEKFFELSNPPNIRILKKHLELNPDSVMQL